MGILDSIVKTSVTDPIRIRWDPVFLGHPDPDPDPKSTNRPLEIYKYCLKYSSGKHIFLSFILNVASCVTQVRKRIQI